MYFTVGIVKLYHIGENNCQLLFKCIEIGPTSGWNQVILVPNEYSRCILVLAVCENIVTLGPLAKIVFASKQADDQLQSTLMLVMSRLLCTEATWCSFTPGGQSNKVLCFFREMNTS